MTRSEEDRSRNTVRLPVRNRPCGMLARSVFRRVTFAGAWLAPCVILVSCGTLDLTRSGRRAASDRKAMDRDFATVPRAFRVMQYAMGRKTDLDVAERHGLGGLVCAVRGDAYYKGEYLRDEAEWMRLTNQVDEVHRRGLKVWLFDERGYPSGGAGDLVVEQDSRHVNLGVFQLWVEGTGIVDRTSIELPGEAYRFVGSSIRQRTESGELRSEGGSGIVSRYAVSTHGMSGAWRFSAFVLRPVVEGTHAATVGPTFGWKGLYPNLLDRRAVAKFIELTHEAYAQRLGPDAMRRIEAIYSNEPSLKPHWFPPGERPSGEAYVPWVASLPGKFVEMHGYELISRMGELFDPETIRRFEAAGGRVVWTGTMPALGAYEREDVRIASLLAGVEAITDRNDILRAVRDIVPPDLSFETDSDAGRRVLVSKFDRAGRALFLVINEAAEPVTLRDVRYREATQSVLYNPYTGTRTTRGAGGPVMIEPRRAVVLAFDALGIRS